MRGWPVDSRGRSRLSRGAGRSDSTDSDRAIPPTQVLPRRGSPSSSPRCENQSPGLRVPCPRRLAGLSIGPLRSLCLHAIAAASRVAVRAAPFGLCERQADVAAATASTRSLASSLQAPASCCSRGGLPPDRDSAVLVAVAVGQRVSSGRVKLRRCRVCHRTSSLATGATRRVRSRLQAGGSVWRARGPHGG